MKKLILSVTALAACSVGAYAQGVIYFSSTSATSPNGLISINGALDTTTDINAELMGSSTGTAGSFTPVAELLLSSSNQSNDGTPGFDPSDVLAAAGDITFKHNGTLLDNSGSFFGIAGAAAGSTEFFEVAGWTGAYDTYAAAQAAGQSVGTSAAFSEVLGASTSPILSTLTTMPSLNLVSVPEPSTLAMAGVGMASMLFLRRKAK
jgi:hypothetical protein